MSEISVRCYPRPLKDRAFKRHAAERLDHIRILAFDTETTTDVSQKLTFGSFRIFERKEMQFEGLFHADDLNEKDRRTIIEYGRDHGVVVMTREEFVEKVFYPEVYEMNTLCLGFNLPFDLSRISIHSGEGRGRNKGAFSLQLSHDPHLPRIVVKYVDRNRSFIRVSTSLPINRGNNRNRVHSRSNPGCFLDCKTLAFALTDKSHSLNSACKAFGAEVCKTEAGEHGKVTPEYIDYNRNDVQATVSLYLRLMEAVKDYHLASTVTKLYSPASVGKDYLDQMGVGSFLEKNPKFPQPLLGSLMQTFFGGRSEVKIRKSVTPVRLIDFLSMYPTICICQNVWGYVISDHIDHYDNTKTVRAFLETVDLDTFSDPASWKELNAICLVQPDDDVLPVRSRYGNKTVNNIGINRLTSTTPLWYALADVVGSKLLTGRTPKVLKAISFVPVGVQPGLRSIRIVGGKEIVPERDDFIEGLMEYRNDTKDLRDSQVRNGPEYTRLDTLQNAIKITTNATSYGIFVEINTKDTAGTKLKVHCGTESFNTETDKVEEFGRFFNPIVGTLITSGARLVLAITEAILKSEGKVHAFCDTDSMAVPEECVERIQAYFQRISPYSFPAPLFKLEKENYAEDGRTLEPLFFYGISAKRYVLYSVRNGKNVIKKASSHGLGHLLNPFGERSGRSWTEVFWQDIIDGLSRNDAARMSTGRFSGHFAMSQITISSPTVLRRFKDFNKGRNYADRIKPFNFALVGMSNAMDDSTMEPVKPIVPFTRDLSKVPYSDFIDYNSGRVLNGLQYWKTLEQTYWDYRNHPESKFIGSVGVLERRHVQNPDLMFIGKESNRLEESEIFGVEPDDNNVYFSKEVQKDLRKELLNFILGLKPKDAARFNISAKQLRRMKQRIADDKLTKLSRKVYNRLMLTWEADKKRMEVIN